jgi:cell division protein DivIC
MSKLRSIWNFVCRHKYMVAIVIFVIVVGFADTNSYYHRYLQYREAIDLQEQINDYKSQYNHDTRMLKQLDANPRAMEKIARERYLMKKPNEDIYIIKDN